MPTKVQRFRHLIEAPEVLIQPDIYDGFSARLGQQMGFKVSEQNFQTTAHKQAKYGMAAE